MWRPTFPRIDCWKQCPYSIDLSWLPCQKSLKQTCEEDFFPGYFHILFHLPRLSVCLMSEGHTSIIPFYFCNFVLGFGTRKCETFRLFGVHWQSLWISGCIDFYFCNNKNATRIFIRVIPNLQITYSVDIILPLPVWRTWSIIPLVCNFYFSQWCFELFSFPRLLCDKFYYSLAWTGRVP